MSDLSNLSIARASAEAYNGLLRRTDESHGGLYKYMGSLPKTVQSIVTGLSSAICLKTNEELGQLSEPADDNVVTLVKAYTDGTDMTAKQVEEAKTWTARMAAQQLADNESEGTGDIALPAGWAAILKKDN